MEKRFLMNEVDETINKQLENAKDLNNLLDIIFDDYLIMYYQDPPPGRKQFLEKLINKINSIRNGDAEDTPFKDIFI